MNASDQVQEYLEGMKIIKSCGLSGVHFKSLDNALLAMKKIAVKVEMAVDKQAGRCLRGKSGIEDSGGRF